MMRAVAVGVGGLYVGLSLVFAWGNDADAAFALAMFGLLALLATLVHPRVGMVGFTLTAVLALLAAVNADSAFLIDAVVYGVLAVLAWRSADAWAASREERRLAAERAERADRYIRQQLGE